VRRQDVIRPHTLEAGVRYTAITAEEDYATLTSAPLPAYVTLRHDDIFTIVIIFTLEHTLHYYAAEIRHTAPPVVMSMMPITLAGAIMPLSLADYAIATLPHITLPPGYCHYEAIWLMLVDTGQRH